ncbi:MAG: type I-C CRISPR-associated protein Cas8c/Csd1 [Anaerolineaceae bacterium]|nr:type I-C CRISPR-associated protein Cas8c/Csd1 [Anaerolineaceae bacterium]
MSWIQKLYETYNNCQSEIGVESNDNEVPLLPICHTTQKAQIEIVIDREGNFRRARVISKNEARTIIPCTESSGGRTSGEAPHPLCDKLQYIAADYSKHTGEKKQYNSSYLKQLENWCNSEFSDPKAIAVLRYVEKGAVIGNLIGQQILIAGEDGKLLKEWDKKKEGDVPKIFGVLVSQEDAFIRWEVEIPGNPETKVWRDKVLWDKWICYYSSTKKEKSLCYVTGEKDFTADQHPAKLRNDGDKAKLISSGKSKSKDGKVKVDDGCGFTFLGRFTNADQAATVSFETTQKAHFALRWLISRQGYRKGDLAIVAWATSGAPIPKPTDDPLSILGFDELPTDELLTASTAQDLAIKLKKKIAGYGKYLGNTTNVVVMGLDSATPGRLAITYYRELTGSDFLQRINDWHQSCAWIHNYGSIEVLDDKSGKSKSKHIPFIGAPAPSDIAEAAYGKDANDKLKQATISRILPCIVDGQQIPRDLVESTLRRASNRIGMEHWEWEKTLGIACALFRKYNEKENYNMALDLNRKTRDYLYGRLLALAESLEEWALNTAGEKRETTAARLMQRFSERPYSTWRTIELSLVPYKARLGGKSKKRQRLIDEVIASFDDNDFLNDKRLSGEFLLGYHCQREYLRSLSDTNKESDDENA